MRKIVVTGSTSMIGKALIESALRRNTEVYAIVRPDTKRMGRIPQSPHVKVVYGDIESIRSINDIPKDCDVFYHFAWIGTSKQDREDSFTQEKNIRYTLDAVELAHDCGCKKFIGAGSQAEYGPTKERIDGKTRLDPSTPYGVSKLAASKLSKSLCEKYGMYHIWGRIFSVYGVYDNEGTMLNYAIDQFLKREKARFSSCSQTWNYLNEHDAGEIFYLLGEKINKTSEYRIAGDENIPLREYINVLSKIMNSDDLCLFAKEPDMGNTVYGINTYDEKLYEEISFGKQIGFEDGIKEVIEYRKHLIEKK